MERASLFENDQDHEAAVAIMNDEVQDFEPSQKSDSEHAAVTPSSPKLRSKDGSGSTSRKCPKKPTTLPNETVEYLKAWMMSPEHIAHPYPTETEKAKIMKDTGLELKQLTNWFVNNRKRYWKPRVEAHLLKDQEVITDIATSTVPLDNEDICRASTKLEKGGSGTFLVENVMDTPSTLRASRRSGQKGKSYFIENMVKAPFATVTPNSHTTSAHLISGHNSLASQSDGTASCSDSDDERFTDKVQTPPRLLETNVHEKIDVHVLRPLRSSSTVPDVTDITVLSNVPPERILKTYPECLLAYNSIPKKNLRSHHVDLIRNAEIVRLKKQYLSVFLAEHENAANTDSGNETNDLLVYAKVTPNDNITIKRKHQIHVIPNGCNEDNDSLAVTSALSMLSPRPKYRRRSIDVWKEACQAANHVYDDDELPSLEEAARLFGYAK
jgi:Homeobox KN domain